MLRTQHDIGTEVKPMQPNGECDYCKTKFPNQTVRKPQLGKRNTELVVGCKLCLINGQVHPWLERGFGRWMSALDCVFAIFLDATFAV